MKRKNLKIKFYEKSKSFNKKFSELLLQTNTFKVSLISHSNLNLLFFILCRFALAYYT